MPTGYTSDVANGKVTDFKEYALQCARAFGALVSLRDEPLSFNIPVFQPSDYHEKAFVRASKELKEFTEMSESDKYEMYLSKMSQIAERNKNVLAEMQEKRKRYEAMLDKARQFKSPSPNHDRYAKFLVEQLESSIEFDCDASYYDEKAVPDFDRWKEEMLHDLEYSVSYHYEALRKEVETTESCNRWVRQLKEALGVS